jgi:uracil-DNA glycosylase
MKHTQWFRDTFNFKDYCKSCKLAHSDQQKNPPIAGTTLCKDLSHLKLIVISDHPGYYEVKNKYCMFDNTTENNKKPLGRPNAGAYIRGILSSWRLDTDKEVYYTNAIKCEPGSKSILAEHIRLCRRKWLLPELIELDKLCPTVPILICGAKAFDAMASLMSETMLDSEASLNQYRRQLLHYNNHPVVVTFNPASVASSIPRIETQNVQTTNLDSVIELPPLKVSPSTIYLDDLQLLKELLCPDTL